MDYTVNPIEGLELSDQLHDAVTVSYTHLDVYKRQEPTVAELEQQARSGQPISLMDLADAVHREEREKKKSVVDQLKSQPKAEHKKTAPKKSTEREI